MVDVFKGRLELALIFILLSRLMQRDILVIGTLAHIKGNYHKIILSKKKLANNSQFIFMAFIMGFYYLKIERC